MRAVLVELDVRRAYDTVSHDAIDEMFERRGLPVYLRAADWREGQWREFTLRASDNTIQFQVQAIQGMPQGALDSLVVYATIVEDMITG